MTLLGVIANNANAVYYNPRLSVWGLAGQQGQVRVDLLFPLFGDQNNLIYTDLQGSYTRAKSANANYAGIGAGFRKLYNANVYGAYLFFDRDKTQLHKVFNVLSLGAESFFQDWDFRINGYFPVNRRSKIVSFFHSQQGCGVCGNNCGNSQFVVFASHQQFENRFTVLEKAGPGFDTEAGYTFHRLNDTQLHAGVYYFNFSSTRNFRNSHNTNTITGIEGRIEVPVNPNYAITIESSYDNYQHGTIMGGLRFNLPLPTQTNPSDMRSHMVDPIIRNLGSLKQGSGIPTVKVKRNDGLFLTRDNIYFFTSEGGSVFVDPSQSGTFENPLRNDQFSQTVVNAVGNNANFYFNPGTYPIMGTGISPNAEINLLTGDSIYGRNLGYQSSAIGDTRPIFLGRINLLQGNNTIDSAQLINREIHVGNTDLNLIALSIQNAPNVLLCNDNINTTVTINGDLQAGFTNTATGINANSSQVLIKNSSISADAVVNGTIVQSGGLTGTNFAVGIGGNSAAGVSANFIGNNFTILNSAINANAAAVTDNGDNFATGIGGNSGNNGLSANFSGNSFLISNSTISSNATVNTIGFSTGDNSAAGIGNVLHFGTANFTNNTFSIQNSQISNIAFATGDNVGGVNNTIGIGSWGDLDFSNNNFNLNNTTITNISKVGGNNNIGINETLGIGNAEFGNNFNNNIFTLTNSQINSTASVVGDNSGFENVAMGIGNISSAAFDNNTFNITGSALNINASVGGDNNATTFNGTEAIGIGGFQDISFANNTFNLTNNSSISVSSSVGGNNNYFNFSFGIGDLIGTHFANNTFNLSNATVSSTDAIISINNSVSNIAIGIGVGPFTSGFTNNTFNLTNNFINSTSSVNGDNSAFNQAFGFRLSTGGNTATIIQSTVDTLAEVSGSNSGSNSATGVVATGVGDTITVSNSIVNTTASASGPGSNTATGHVGNVTSSNTTYNTVP